MGWESRCIVPYDLRRPTFQRLLAAVWSTHDSRLFMPHGFGMGWTVNVGRLVQLARRDQVAHVERMNRMQGDGVTANG